MEGRISSGTIGAFVGREGVEKCTGVGESQLVGLLRSYSEVYFDLSEELFVEDTTPDNPQPMVEVLVGLGERAESHRDLMFWGARFLRILSRKPTNQRFFDEGIVKLSNMVFSIGDNELKIEMCSVLLRILSYVPFSRIVLREPEPFFTGLLECFQSIDENLSMSATAALQSFGYHQGGKEFICSRNVHVKAIAMMLERPVGSGLFNRLLGFLHNVSSEGVVVKSLRDSGAINEVLEAIGIRPYSSMTIDAAGIIQNVARDESCRKRLIEGEAVDSLMGLIMSGDVQIQVRAVGAILNLLSPMCDDVNGLKQALSRLIALSALQNAL